LEGEEGEKIGGGGGRYLKEKKKIKIDNKIKLFRVVINFK